MFTWKFSHQPPALGISLHPRLTCALDLQLSLECPRSKPASAGLTACYPVCCTIPLQQQEWLICVFPQFCFIFSVIPSCLSDPRDMLEACLRHAIPRKGFPVWPPGMCYLILKGSAYCERSQGHVLALRFLSQLGPNYTLAVIVSSNYSWNMFFWLCCFLGTLNNELSSLFHTSSPPPCHQYLPGQRRTLTWSLCLQSFTSSYTTTTVIAYSNSIALCLFPAPKTLWCFVILTMIFQASHAMTQVYLPSLVVLEAFH